MSSFCNNWMDFHPTRLIHTAIFPISVNVSYVCGEMIPRRRLFSLFNAILHSNFSDFLNGIPRFSILTRTRWPRRLISDDITN